MREPSLPYAGFMHRLSAFLADNVIVGFGVGFVSPVIPANAASMVSGLSATHVLLFSSAYFVYEAGCLLSPWHATPGKRYYGLAPVSKDGTELQPFQVLARTSLKMLVYEGVLLFQAIAVIMRFPAMAQQVGTVTLAALFLANFLLPLVSPRKQALHDVAVGSVVLRLGEAPASLLPFSSQAKAVDGRRAERARIVPEPTTIESKFEQRASRKSADDIRAESAPHETPKGW